MILFRIALLVISSVLKLGVPGHIYPEGARLSSVLSARHKEKGAAVAQVDEKEF